MEKLLFLFFIPISVFAYPNPRDSVVYSSTLRLNSCDNYGSCQFSLQKTILEFDKIKNKFKINEVLSKNGEIMNRKSYFISSEKLYNRAKVLDILKNCKKYGGITVELTMKPGNFPTCEMIGKENEPFQKIWIADVPFGYVKIITDYFEDTLDSYSPLNSY